jgi:hypothetical protein
MNRINGNKYFEKYVRFYISFGNLTITVDQQHDLRRQTQKRQKIYIQTQYWRAAV